MEEVADIGEIVLGEQRNTAFRMGDRRRQRTDHPLPDMFIDAFDHVLDIGAFLRLVHAVEITRVVDAVAEELPMPFLTLFDNFRMMVQRRDIERDAATNAIFIHNLQHAPKSGPIAVIPVRIVDHIRQRPRHGAAMRIERRLEFVILDIRRDPEGNLFAFGPGEFRPVDIRPVVVMSGIAYHGTSTRNRYWHISG